MIERIRELVYQAANGMLSYDAEGDWSLNQHEVEKFSELIIRECADRIRFCIKNDIDFIAEDIEKYFGVENE